MRWSVGADQGCGDGRETLSASSESEAVRRGGGETDRGSDGRRQHGLSLCPAPGQVGTVADHLHGDVHHLVARGVQQGNRLGEEGSSARSGPLRPGGTEVAAQVAEARGRQQRIAGGVRDDVPVRMAGEPERFAGELQPCHPERDPGRERVGVTADADPDVHS